MKPQMVALYRDFDGLKRKLYALAQRRRLFGEEPYQARQSPSTSCGAFDSKYTNLAIDPSSISVLSQSNVVCSMRCCVVNRRSAS